LSSEYPDIIQCECGQRMRLPADSQSKYFRCVKCGSYVDRKGIRKKDTQKLRRSGLKISSGRGLHRSGLLGTFVDGGLISPQQGEEAAAAAKESGEKTFQAIVRLGFATREQLHAFLVRESGAASISLSHFSIEQSIASILPREMVLKNLILPIDKLGKSLTVAMVCPMDTNAVKAAEEHTNLRIRPMLCVWDEFEVASAKLYPEPKTPQVLKASDEQRFIEDDDPVEHSALPEKKVELESDFEETPAETEFFTESEGNVSERLRLLKTLEIPSRVMNRLDAVLGADAEGLKKITGIVSNSPPFSARIVGMANSAAYGLPGKVDNIPTAVALLGAETIALVATGTPKQSSQGERSWFLLTRFSRHVAKINASLASFTEKALPNTAYCIGLLHGLGSYALGAMSPDEYQKIDPRLTGFARAKAENNTIGMSHAEAGWLLARSWNLPDSIIAGITHYLKPENAPENADIAYMLHIAVNLASADGVLDLKKLKRCKEALEYFNITVKDTARALETSSYLAPAEAAK
jgi:HD-like signal output (HDOD) protein